MGSHSIWSVIAIVVLVIMSAYFSATETAFTSLNRIRVKNMAGEGNKKAKLVMKLSDEYDKLLSAILIGNNIVNIAMTAIATVLFVGIYGAYVGATAATVVITIVVLIFGEITPKNVAKEKPEKFAMFSARIIHFFMILLTPLIVIFFGWKKLISKLFKLDYDNVITEEELITIVEEAETEGGIGEEQSELIQNAIEFNDLDAWDVLTPRVDLVAIDVSTPEKEIAELFRKTGFSRLPVYEDEIDNILGVLNQKDFHNEIYGTKKKVSEYIKQVVFVAGTIKISVLLKKMQQAKTHIAVVVDEYGGTEGIVTMEDIIEELVGEIYDEHDIQASQDIIQLRDGSYRVLGSANIDKVLDFFDEEDDDIDATTVNGFIVSELDNLPRAGDMFTYETAGKIFHVRVTKADEKKALEANFIIEEKPQEEEE
ncbi:MAG: HlyC/CorC family transporter [Eubacteriales Family XIII. Incertae Sedis bacterium]|nr:MAG: HlyC/CorC family transporter [Clostridiales Family XIII bacterium]